MKRITLSFIIFLIVCPFVISCGNKNESRRSGDADVLFTQSVNLLNQITQQLTFAKDSLSVDSLSDLFEKKIVEINFSVSPETDLNLTEQENDSLSKLYRKYLSIKRAKLIEFSITYNDSVSIKEEKENVF